MNDSTGASGATSSQKSKLDALQNTLKALAGLSPEDREHVLRAVVAFFDIALIGGVATVQPAAQEQPGGDGASELEHDLGSGPEESSGFEEFAELFHAAGPPTKNPDKALVGGYWLQVCQGAEGFKSYLVNRELKEAGFEIPNITNAFNALKKRKPALVIQTATSGTKTHARKFLKLTSAGIQTVERMLSPR